MMMPSKAVPAGAEGQALYKRLWIHEVMRVFHDRLVDTPDRSWLLTKVCSLPILQNKHTKSCSKVIPVSAIRTFCKQPDLL